MKILRTTRSFQPTTQNKPRVYHEEMRPTAAYSRGPAPQTEEWYDGIYETREDSESNMFHKARSLPRAFPNLLKKMRSLKGKAPRTQEEVWHLPNNVMGPLPQVTRMQPVDAYYPDDYAMIVPSAPFDDESSEDWSLPVSHVEVLEEELTLISTVTNNTSSTAGSLRRGRPRRASHREPSNDFFSSAWNLVWPYQGERGKSAQKSQWNVFSDFFHQDQEEEAVDFVDDVLLAPIEEACLGVAGVTGTQEMNTSDGDGSTVVHANTTTVTKAVETEAVSQIDETQEMKTGAPNPGAQRVKNTIVIEVRRDPPAEVDNQIRVRVADVRNKKKNKRILPWHLQSS